jgi:hypothetical protein
VKGAVALFIAATLLAPQASAAPKAIVPGLGSIYNAPAGSEAMVLSGKNTIFIQNINQLNSDIKVTALDATRNQIWERIIDSKADEVATAVTTDPSGNIWLAGAAAALQIAESVTSIAGIDNPDSVSVDGAPIQRGEMLNLALWKISPTGELLSTFQLTLPAVPSVNALAVNNLGISVIGALDSKPFLVTATIAGQFNKPLYIGTSKTELNAVARYSDGSTTIFGSSTETLGGKKVAGVRDGVLIKISKAGAISSVVRSSANKASRSWISGDSSNLTSGPVITGSTVESAITKFSPTFAPTWTLRVPSSGPSLTLTANGNSYLAFTSRGAISGIAPWKPAKPALIVLTFDSKGVLKAATALPGLVKALALQYSVASGVVGLASGGDESVSIFTLVSR